ncbi:hypothetical protein V8F20_011688 [Naviculisporaceae sp. PSN 640]
MATKAEAKEAVLSISRKFGFVGDDIMSQIEAWNPKIRRIIEESMLAKDTLAAHSIKTLARNIYGSDARFVFELLQNADDNRFERAKTCPGGALPSISFQVHPNRTIVECNEDGFTVNDLLAICSVGESTKSGSHGYIGAKGIGFKSVFIAAWKVYIQSGNFSYYFKHRKGDSGLGMVLPIWVDTDEELPTPLTRMTLYLHEEGDPTELEHLRNTIFQQLNDLHETCLLFLRNLKQIQVSFHSEDGEQETSKVFRVGETDVHRFFLETTSTNRDGEVTLEKKQYHVTRHTASNLPPSNNRETSETESATAEVVLAFPLTEEFIPLIEKQQVFAFLPVRMSDFTFLIQSDFDTSANRQDVLTTSRRNIALLDAIAAAFVKAVLEFCEHKDLCYTWPDFLPSPDAQYSSGFWEGLVSKLKACLSETPVLRSRHHTHLRLIRDVHIVGNDTVDANGDPLLDDPEKDVYVSGLYTSRATESLGKYGLSVGYAPQRLDALEADLMKPTSRMKSESTDADWHSRVAKLFSSYFTKKWQNCTDRLKTIAFLPLRSGEWVSANSGAIYLPTSNGFAVPHGLDIRVLDPKAVANQDRRGLFVLLGASEPSIESVRSLIQRVYWSASAPSDLSESKAHLHFLYYTHNQKQPAPTEFKSIRIFGHNNIPENPGHHDFYLPSHHAYGPETLLAATADAPGYPVTFLNPAYLKDEPDPPTPSHPKWTKWLRDTVGVRERLRLISRRGDSLSDIWRYVRDHRPEKLLGFLKYLWKYEESRIVSSKALIEEIKNTSATKLCVSKDCPPWSDWTLGNSWLPLPHLQRRAAAFMKENEPFPFLLVEDSVSVTADDMKAEWAFLHTFLSVGKDENITFLLHILQLITNYNEERIVDPERVLNLYIAIDAKCIGALDRQAERKLIRDSLDDWSVFLSGSDFRSIWYRPDEVLWEAPPDMQTVGSLKHSYSQIVGPDSDQMRLLSHFFEQTLSVKRITWRHVTQELQHLAEHPTSDGKELWDLDRIRGLYEYLGNMNIVAFSDDMRREFEQKSLIFVNKNGQPSWHKTADCLWSSTAEILGKATLNDHYEDLRSFFVDVLGVQTLTLQIVYDDLVESRPQRPRTVNDIKNTIWSFNSLIQTEPDMRRQLDPEPVLKASVFPVRYPGDGGKRLVSAKDVEFAIVDREHLAGRFEGRIKFLDYDLAEVRRLQPFLEWCNLGHRYISRSVKEITSVSSGQTGRSISNSHRDIKRKAHAILRIAATFGSPRYKSDPEALYQLLRTARVVETDGISCLLSISQAGRAVEVEEPVGEDLHISEGDDSGLTIYVPRNKDAQEFCFGSLLPERLADWLMRDPISQILGGHGSVDGCPVDNAMIAVLTTVLAFDVSALSRTLDRRGIVQVSIANEDIIAAVGDDIEEDAGDDIEEDAGEEQEIDYFGTDDFDDDDLSTLIDPSTTPPGTSTPATSPPSEHTRVVDVLSRQSHWAVATTSAPPRPVIPTAVSQFDSSSVEDHRYRALISWVITVARSDTSNLFPRAPSAANTNRAFDMSDLLSSVPFTSSTATSTSGTWFSSQTERDKKIGALGELYVFELLCKLSLNGFGRHNWQSTIRRYIAGMHADYMDLDAWSGRETADITYRDVTGEFGRLLRENGYTALDDNEEEEPEVDTEYFIEVKTTTGGVETPFYLSKGQYARMQDIHNNRRARKQVYMILRVFGIESIFPSVRVYMDPEHLRLSGALLFTGETWSVVPARPSPTP